MLFNFNEIDHYNDLAEVAAFCKALDKFIRSQPQLHTFPLQLVLKRLYQHGDKVRGTTYYSILEDPKSKHFIEIPGSHGIGYLAMSRICSNGTNICCRVTGDLFHYGHLSFFKKARKFGEYLLVGVHSDEDVAIFKWPPVLNLNERVAVIESCKLVNEVIPSAPPETTENFIKKYNIDLVVATKAYSKEDLNTFYKDPQKMNILKLVDYEESISTSAIVEKCAQLFKKRKNVLKKI